MNTNYTIHDELYKDARRKGWNGWGGNDRLEKRDIMLERIFSNKKTPIHGKVLELGCGEGNLSRLLFEKGFEVTGIDISQTAIKWAIEKAKKLSYQINFKQADLSKRGVLDSDKYDLIVDGNCLHCIIGQDRKIFLQNVYFAMEKNGVFFVSSICTKKDENEIILLKGKPYRFVSTEDSILKELKEVGFLILESKVYSNKDCAHITVHLTK